MSKEFVQDTSDVFKGLCLAIVATRPRFKLADAGKKGGKDLWVQKLLLTLREVLLRGRFPGN